MEVGAFFPSDLEENFGAAYLFEKEGGQWVQKARLPPENPDARDNFGKSVAISREIAVVGADASDVISGAANTAPGFVYVFERNIGGEANWGQTARLGVNEQRDVFGAAVAIHHDVLAVGATGHGPQRGKSKQHGSRLHFRAKRLRPMGSDRQSGSQRRSRESGFRKRTGNQRKRLSGWCRRHRSQ